MKLTRAGMAAFVCWGALCFGGATFSLRATESYRISYALSNTFAAGGGGDNIDEVTSQTPPLSVDFGGLTATAAEGSLVINASASGSGGGNSQSRSGDVTYRNTRFSLDPAEVGKVGTVEISYTISASGGGTHNFSAGAITQGSSPLLFKGQPPASVPAPTGTFSVDIAAGFDLELTAAASTQGGGRLANSPSGSATASASLTYAFTLIEDRLHWNDDFGTAGGTMETGNETQWSEFLAPGATQWAVFNKAAPRNQKVTLDANRTWRGLVVDGETLDLDLDGKTLALGTEGLSQKGHNILVGEGRATASMLTLRRGVVTGENDIVIGGTAKNSASLTLDQGAQVSLSSSGLPSVTVGRQGSGTLTVRGGSTLVASAVLLAALQPATPDDPTIVGGAFVEGVGSRLTAQLLSVGEQGDGALTARASGRVETSGLKVGDQLGSNGTVIVEGAGTVLAINASFADIGRLGHGSVEVRDGALLDGSLTKINIGGGDASRFSVLRLTGAGTTMTETGVDVRGGGLFEVRDGAAWTTDQANFFSMSGGETRVQQADAKIVDGVMTGGTLNINAAGLFEVTSEFFQEGGRVNVNGTGARLFGFADYKLNGTLNVGNGGEVFAGEGGVLSLDIGASIEGRAGTIHASVQGLDGVIRPGESPGTLSIDGNLTLGGRASLELEIGGLAAGIDYDQLLVSGNVSLDGGPITLQFINGFAPRAGQTFQLLQAGGTLAATAPFQVTGLEPGWEFVTAFDGASDQFTLTSLNDGIAAVPEPSTLALLTLPAALMALRTRRWS